MSEGSPTRAIIGVSISLLASLIDAIGVNLQRFDHIRNASKPIDLQRPLYLRPIWALGFFLYATSQIFGSSAALSFLQPAVVAPLGAAALVFNLIFASVLNKTRISKNDIIGISLIIGSTVLIAIFGEAPKEKLSVDMLLKLYKRGVFIGYFVTLLTVAISVFLLALHLNRLGSSEPKRIKSVFSRVKSSRLQKLAGVCYAVTGGMNASFTVILAEGSVRLIQTSLNGHNQFQYALPWIIISLLVFSAIIQASCMVAVLKVCDTVLALPISMGVYSTLALINQNVYYDQWSKYSPLNYGMLIPSFFIVTFGVYLISEDKFHPTPEEEEVLFASDLETDTEGKADETTDFDERSYDSSDELLGN